MKCVSSDPASATCDRCQRLRRQCVYESHRRGLWRRDQTGRREERARPEDEHIEELPSTSGPAASHHLLPGPTVQSADPVPDFQTSSFQSRASESVSASSRSDQSPFTPASFVTNSQDTRGLSLAAALDPDRSVDREPRSHLDELPQSNQETADMPRKDDPVDMGLISRPSAQYLYEGCGYLIRISWTYPLGDGKAVGGHELTGIACSVYESMMKTRVDPDSDTSLSTLDFETFQKDMEEFNTRIIAWGDYWRPVFATFPDPEPFQTPLIYLFRDYMRLYFNSVFLHPRTTRICYSSALSVLQQTIEMGEMDTVYYLWDTAHLMIAYSSMMIPKLLRQTVDEPVISRTEALNVLTQVTTTYVIAAKSMGNPEPRVLESRMENTGATNAVSVQAHLLSAILARLKADVSLAENDLTTQSVSSIPSGTSLSWIEDQLNRSTLFSDGRMEPQQAEYIDLDVPTASHPHDIGSLTPQMNEGLDLMLDNDFINSRYFDVGLSSWDEPGIFIRPH
ncbi:hypothetical protein QSH57_008738 [Fusarium oxysporum f. sp. vasinfectum]|nr:hypothetical protein QSH57_008738 [Fusarium oxysporum f. sp. vasinfectum]